MAERNFMVGPMQATVQRRLADLTRSVDESDTELCSEKLADLARVEIPLLIAALRDTLEEHRPDSRGRCPVCPTRFARLRLRRRGQAPCRAYLAVQLRLGTDAAAMPASTSHQKRRKRNPHYVS